MIIQISGVSKERTHILRNEGFIKSGVMESNDEPALYTILLDDSVILKAGYHITLDKGGKLFTLYNNEFKVVRII